MTLNSKYVYVTRFMSDTPIGKYKVNTYKIKDLGIDVESKTDITTQLQVANSSSYDVDADDDDLVASKKNDKVEIFKKNVKIGQVSLQKQ